MKKKKQIHKHLQLLTSGFAPEINFWLYVTWKAYS